MAMSDVRQQTCYLMELMDDGVLDPRAVADACLLYLSEQDVKDMAHHNELPMCDDEDEEEGEDEEEEEV